MKRPPHIHGSEEKNTAIEKTVDEIRLTTGITISRGEALHLIAGGTSCINGKWRKGSASGEIFPAAPSRQVKASIQREKTEKILKRVEDLSAVVRRVDS